MAGLTPWGAMRGVVGLVLAITSTAQDRFSTQSRLVLVPVTATDSKGRSVNGLKPSDFQLFDNGRPQPFEADTFGAGAAPIALAVAVQSSGISAPALEKIKGIGSMIQPLIIGSRGCAALVSFDERVEWQQDWTNDPDELILAFGRLAPGGEKSARMLDAAYDAVDRLRERWNARRVLLLISESRDRGSETDLEAVLIAAQTAGVTVYAATYSAFKTSVIQKSSPSARLPDEPPPSRRPPKSPPPAGMTRYPTPTEQRVDILGGLGELARLGDIKTTEALAGGTGGETFSFTRKRGLEGTIEKLGEELHAQYVLSFVPEKPAQGYHPLEVRIGRAGKFRIRARPGYWWTP